ncbi:hypothetical protein BDF20DRAFT_881619 [Mycotypha africana]|uniref:uncharacterized protein n=1 Tax=Mycotypha africana TaxID=64632 RepID=UPI0023008CCA|nr:uncharacterized protein BDF20DRAFT_881619 [Mycotypha africana]KAI8973303.1 hypothetical protein BDF20DRAFT_881619 [Mycotypha africana]
MEENISENTVEIDEIEIDMLNDNTFMRALTEALQKLHNIITPPENYTGDNMPSWLQSLLNAFNEFSDNENEDNIKYQVYIAKLITNYPFAFEKYAKYWILPLMKFIIKGHMFGSPINYLTQDLCIILIVWGKDTDIPDKHQPSTQQTLYSFFVYLIKNAYHSTPRITRSNIQIIKGIFENWGEICPVPTRVIYEQFHHPEGQEDRNIIGLQLAGILYSNGVNIYNTNDISDTTVIDKFIFYEDMAANLKHKNRKSADTSLNAAELMSWTLKIMRDKKDPDEKEIRKMFERQLEKLFENKNLSRKHCLKCVNRAYLHDVDLGKSVIHKVAYRLNDYTMDEKALLLEYLNVCWTEEYDADMLYKIRQIGLLRLLTGRDEVLQIASLKILNTFFSTIKKADVGKFLKRLVKAFPNHPNMKCRTLYYSFLKKVYESKLDPTIETDVKAQLFRGLIDRAASISQDIFEFVKMQLQIDDNILSTVQKLLSVFFVAETEDIYLLYATRIMLNNMRETADFTEPLFDQPLDKTKRFDSEYKFNTAWYNTSSMVPLFVESQEKSQLSIEDLELQLRQTQSLLEFSTTQGTNQTLISTFNPASQETQPTEDISDDVVMAETSSLPSPKFEKKENPYYNRRFLAESRGVSKRFHADRNEQLEKKMRNLLNSRKEAGEKKVVLTRTYRQGEIPDVQISRRDLLLPLEVIATADYNISRLLYSSLTVGIANEFKQSATDEDYATYKEQLVDSIGKNLVKSCMYFTPTIGSFLRIVFDLDAYIPGKVIKVVSARSQNHHIGIAILEKHIMYSGGDDRPKKKVSQLTPTKEKWIHLSLLYQSIDEPEIFQNIYLNNVVENELARDGIEYEIKGNYADAFNKLATASDTSDPKSVDIVEYNLWQEQMLFCRTQLTEWEKISQDTFQATGGNWKSLWGDLQDPYLEYFVRSFSKFKINRPPYDYREADSPGPTTWLKHQPNPLYKFLDDAYDEDVRREKLLDDFACEWAIMEMYRKNYYRGRFFISKAYDSILSAWNTLHPLAHTSRLTKLSRLQRTVEIDDYLRFHKCLEGGFFDLNEFEKFIGALALRYPDTVSDRMDTWYDILITRLEFFDDFTETLLKMSDSANALIRSAKNESLLAIANAAIIQGNANVFAKIRDMFDARARDKRELTNIQYLQRVNTVTLDIQSKGRYLGLLFSKTAKNKIFETAESNDAYNWKLVQLDSFDIVKQNLVSNPDIFNYFTEDALRKFRSSDNWKQILANAGNLANHLEKAGFETLQTAGELLDAENSQRAEYLWRFGKYCDDALRLANDPSSTIHLTLDSTEYGKLVVKCYFQAMDRDHALATGYFPRLMELIELNPDVGDTFMEQSRQLDASWKFIRWIPQLVSFIATPIATFVFVALERIAHNYPKALYYPMQMSYEFYELRKHHLSEETNTFIEKIMALIRSPILEEFSKELKRLTDPALIFRDFVDFVKSINVTEAPRTFIASKYDEFYQLLLNNYSERLGAVQKKVASKYASSIIRMFGEEGAKIPEFTDRNYRELNTLLKTKIEPLTPTESESRSLKAYSPWLHSFKNIEHDEPLEIPGQYTGLSKPYPETHVRIASIDPQILCMRSLRRPKRITLNGTDEMEYHFLVKGGEDLRLDERIEQLFSVMNDALRKNAFCSNQNVRMTTYKVIPMASNLGIIEWVKYTAPLRSTIQRVDTKSVSEAATAKYRAWIISNKRGASDMRSQYHAAFSQPREKIVQMFENARSRFPRKVLKDYLFHLASSPEAFIFLRKEFAHSLACISIYGYIVGIGDRHLDNFLLDLKSGRLVPIDFGYAFGAATELLAIPELVPFRLTRQLITVLEPLGTSGILENAMANILSAVQNEKELLLNVLSVFVKEPLLEWKRQADRLAKQQRKERVSDDDKHSTSATPSKDNCLEWYPQKKIDIVKRKLDMHNPAGTVIAELQNGHADKPYCKDLTRLAKGIARVNLRADVGDVCDSVNEQVKCLIDLATDPAVLGVAYLGWGSFF